MYFISYASQNLFEIIFGIKYKLYDIFQHFFLSEPTTKILSETSLHVEQDSSINLTCIASNVVQHSGKSSPYSDTGILWYKNEKVILKIKMTINVRLQKYVKYCYKMNIFNITYKYFYFIVKTNLMSEIC
jgi:hypothetical protein